MSSRTGLTLLTVARNTPSHRHSAYDPLNPARNGLLALGLASFPADHRQSWRKKEPTWRIYGAQIETLRKPADMRWWAFLGLRPETEKLLRALNADFGHRFVSRFDELGRLPVEPGREKQHIAIAVSFPDPGFATRVW